MYLFAAVLRQVPIIQPGLAWTDSPPASAVGLPVPPHPAQRLIVFNGYLTHELEVPYPNPSQDLDTGQGLGRQWPVILSRLALGGHLPFIPLGRCILKVKVAREQA